LQRTRDLEPVPSFLVTFFLCVNSYFQFSLSVFFALCHVCLSSLIYVFMPKKEKNSYKYCRNFPRHSESRLLKSYVFIPCLGKWYYNIIIRCPYLFKKVVKISFCIFILSPCMLLHSVLLPTLCTYLIKNYHNSHLKPHTLKMSVMYN